MGISVNTTCLPTTCSLTAESFISMPIPLHCEDAEALSRGNRFFSRIVQLGKIEYHADEKHTPILKLQEKADHLLGQARFNKLHEALRALNKIKDPIPAKDLLNHRLQKFSILIEMDESCAEKTPLAKQNLRSQIHNTAIGIANCYKTLSKYQVTHHLQKGHPTETIDDTNALIMQAHYLSVAGDMASTPDRQIKHYDRAVKVLNRICKKNLLSCIDNPYYNYLDKTQMGFAKTGHFSPEHNLQFYLHQVSKDLAQGKKPNYLRRK